jgi:3D (Asp-Asp-Asp) domain-containing protein
LKSTPIFVIIYLSLPKGRLFNFEMKTFLKIFLGLAFFFKTVSFALSPSLAENISQEELFTLESKGVPLFIVVTVTGYSSSYDETDEDPWITANNTVPRFGIVATNDLPLGTKIKIPEIFGDQIFIVEDRMNKRFKNRIDVWFPSKEDALNFGIKENVLVEIVP